MDHHQENEEEEMQLNPTMLVWLAVLNGDNNSLKIRTLQQLHAQIKYEIDKENDNLVVEVSYVSHVCKSFIQPVLKAYFSQQVKLRREILGLFKTMFGTGSVDIEQIISHVICMTSDPAPDISKYAKEVYTKALKVYPTVVKRMQPQGIKNIYKLYHLLYGNNSRGYTMALDGTPEACLEFIFNSCIIPDMHFEPLPETVRGGIVRFLLISIGRAKTFNEAQFYADMLVYFPYVLKCEVLFAIQESQIELQVGGEIMLCDFISKLGMTKKEFIDASKHATSDMIKTLEYKIPVIKDFVKKSEIMILFWTIKNHLSQMYNISTKELERFTSCRFKETYETGARRRKMPMYEMIRRVPSIEGLVCITPRLLKEIAKLFMHLEIQSRSE